MQENKRGRIFSLEEELLWIMDLLFGEKRWFEVKTPYEFVLYKQICFTRLDWTGVVWITCGLL